MFIYLIFILALGLIIGSFLNVIIFRLKNGGKIIWDRSKCPSCKKELEVLDLVPVLSFLFLKGHCRYCKKKISWQYPLVEISTALLFIFIFLNLPVLISNFPIISFAGNLANFVFFSILIASLIVIFVYDLKYYLIPDSVLLLPLVLTIFLLLLSLKFHNLSLIDNLAGAIVFSGFFLLQYVLSKGQWVGGGDIKMGFLLGLVLGFKLSLVCLFLAYTSGAIIALFLIATKQKTRKDILPFGPFLISSFIFTLFYGQYVLNWYLNLLIQ